jgi:cytochrome c-type biogenesis protein
MAADVSIPVVLLAGLISFLSPCVLPLVPPYLVYLSGLSLERIADAEPEPAVRRETVVGALLFVLGFSTVFVALGASASAIGGLIRAYADVLAKVAGVAIIIMGLHFLGLLRVEYGSLRSELEEIERWRLCVFGVENYETIGQRF